MQSEPPGASQGWHATAGHAGGRNGEAVGVDDEVREDAKGFECQAKAELFP